MTDNDALSDASRTESLSDLSDTTAQEESDWPTPKPIRPKTAKKAEPEVIQFESEQSDSDWPTPKPIRPVAAGKSTPALEILTDTDSDWPEMQPIKPTPAFMKQPLPMKPLSRVNSNLSKMKVVEKANFRKNGLRNLLRH